MNAVSFNISYFYQSCSYIAVTKIVLEGMIDNLTPALALHSAELRTPSIWYTNPVS